MKIYTKGGDRGQTGLFGGKRVSKADLRVAAYGEVDELNAHLGWAAALLGDLPLAGEIRTIQADLMVLCADLATSPDASEAVRAKSLRLGPERAIRLEALIDRLEAENAPLKHFILPGGSPRAAALQVCRTVCRRAERAVVRLAGEEPVNGDVEVYLNRLSDALFVLARRTNALDGFPETAWRGLGGGA